MVTNTVIPPTSSEDTVLQDRYNQEIAETLTKLSAKIEYIKEIPDGLDAQGIIDYLQQIGEV